MTHSASSSTPSLLRRWYNTCLHEANSRKTRWIMYGISFLESSVFPLPPDLLIVPIVLASPKRAWSIAFWTTVFSVIGGIVGYGIGYFLIDQGQWIIKTYHLERSLMQFQTQFKEWGFWIIVIKGLTPIPFKLVTIASGMAHFSLMPFIGASIIARAFRFFLLSFLLKRFGPWAREFIEKYLSFVLGGILITIIIGFLLVHFLS